jgi:hypothetical protein
VLSVPVFSGSVLLRTSAEFGRHSAGLEESWVSLVRCFDAGAGNGRRSLSSAINNPVMIRPLPFADPARLAAVFRSKIANLGAPPRRGGSPAHVDDPVIYLGLKKVGETAQVLCLKWSEREDLTKTAARLIVRQIQREIGSAETGHRAPLRWICHSRA